MQIVCGRKLLRFLRISYLPQKFSSESFIKLVNKVLHERHNRESFPTNFNKTLQLRKFSTINDLHYVVYDTLRGQCTETIPAMLEDNNVYIIIVPANCTDRLRPLGLSINRAAKEFPRKQFTEWYSDQICQQLYKGIKPAKVIDL